MEKDKSNKNEESDKIEKFEKENKEKISKLYEKKLEKEGVVKFGDVHYTKKEFDKIMENLKK